MLTRLMQFVLWLVVLVVGLGVLAKLTWHTGLAGSGLGTGVFSYHMNARIRLSHEGSRPFFGTVRVAGNNPARFKIWGRVSPRYSTVEVDWEIFRNGPSEGQAVIDLERAQIVHHSKTFPLKGDALCRLFGIAHDTEADKAIGSALMALLESVRDGTLPLPNHHSYPLEHPIPGRLRHAATGFALLPLDIVWIAVWSFFGCRSWLKCRAAGQADEAG